MSITIYSADRKKAQAKCSPQSDSLRLKAEEFWNFFRPLVSAYQVAPGSPAAGPRNTEIVSAIQNRGTKGCCTFTRENGTYILHKFHRHVVERSLRSGDKLFYCGGAGRSFLLYLDIDCHKLWQSPKDGVLAQWLIECLDLPIYNIGSDRGRNGYLIVNRGWYSPERANAALDRFCHAIRLLLAKYECLADFEVKGSVGHLQGSEWKRGSYGKLPIHHQSFDLDDCKNALGSGVSIQYLDQLANSIIAQVPNSHLTKMTEKKRELERRHQPQFIEVTPKVEAKLRKLGTWKLAMVGRHENDDGSVLVDRKYLQEPEPKKCSLAPLAAQSTSTAGRLSGSVPHRQLPNCEIEHRLDESDSFKRQHHALLGLCRKLKYVPDVEVALAFIEENNLFSGDWDQNSEKRRRRVSSILAFIARTFDPKKLNKGHVEIGKYDQWVAKHFPNGINGKRRTNRPDETVECRSVSVTPDWISVALSIIDFCLLAEPCSDGSLPQERAKQLWISLTECNATSTKWDGRKWLVVREALVNHRVIEITDRAYEPDKAMRWAVGRFFPFLRLWAKKAVKAIRGLVAIVWNNGEKEGHNTLVETATPFSALLAHELRLRQDKPPLDSS